MTLAERLNKIIAEQNISKKRVCNACRGIRELYLYSDRQHEQGRYLISHPCESHCLRVWLRCELDTKWG